MLKAITANRLRDGEVIFLAPGPDLGPDLGWVERLDGAALFEDAAAADTALAAAKAKAEGEQFAVDVYAFELRVVDGQRVPVKTRERIRALGPTVRIDLGKQAAA
ncbi:DUF2849 domain-containing protein [Azospirillum brasilense]|uniref:DUF2849 domain-containing protein n=1 Tax=Azospirillum brasilense TaxID=192 RepID=A0A4D8QK63_AZOBR|nr:DUF2849 domain-containing protein [Azospirillum brasilense]QEL91277.1 DUF2849 domain-containing protein [Azospirillum brasilense]QEL97571.1 DUF2849 domain-containing protein [Azospirillum brasilense]